MNLSIPAEDWDNVRPEDRTSYLRDLGVPISDDGTWLADVGMELKTIDGKATWTYYWDA